MNELNWIKQEFGLLSLESQEIQHILNFGLVWNIFECLVSSAIRDSESLAQTYSDKIDYDILDNVFQHFKTRYIDNYVETTNFTNFKFNPNDGKEIVSAILKDSNPTNQKKLEAILKIIFRLRNNLFHGEKDIQTIPSQNENFKYANMLLMEIIQKRTPNQGTTR